MFICVLLCSSPAPATEKAPVITPVRNTAVGYALTLDRVTSSFEGKCVNAGGAKAARARAAWKARNGELVDSADRYLRIVRNLIKQSHGEEAARRFYEEQKATFAKHAELTVWDSMLSGSGRAEVCGRMLGAIAEGRMDFTATPEHFRTLKEISEEVARVGVK